MKTQLIGWLPMLGIALLLGACQQQNGQTTTSTQSGAQTGIAAVQLGNGQIVELSCVQQAAQTGASPSNCPALTPTSQSSQVAAQVGAVGERGCYQPYGWFDYYGSPSYQNYYYYYNPTQVPGFCGAVGYSGNCYPQMGYGGYPYTPYSSGSASFDFTGPRGNTYQGYANWNSSVAGWWWR